jgi:hypothetical protein
VSVMVGVGIMMMVRVIVRKRQLICTVVMARVDHMLGGMGVVLCIRRGG